MMQLNPDALQKLLAESDEVLWQTIRKIGAINGVKLPTAMPPPADMKKLRTLLGGAGNQNVEDAVQLVERYRQEHKS